MLNTVLSILLQWSQINFSRVWCMKVLRVSIWWLIAPLMLYFHRPFDIQLTEWYTHSHDIALFEWTWMVYKCLWRPFNMVSYVQILVLTVILMMFQSYCHDADIEANQSELGDETSLPQYLVVFFRTFQNFQLWNTLLPLMVLCTKISWAILSQLVFSARYQIPAENVKYDWWWWLWNDDW